MKSLLLSAGLLMLGLCGTPSCAQLDPLSSRSTAPNPLTSPTVNPATTVLYDLEARFAADVATGGGKAFASWFAEDGLELPNGKAPVIGQRAVRGMADWDPKTYQLTWTPDGARIGPSGDTGFTWGTYQSHSRDSNGEPVQRSGRYITFWKKENGAWKVALDASADAPEATDCCALPKP